MTSLRAHSTLRNAAAMAPPYASSVPAPRSIEVDTEMTTRVFSSISRPGRSLHEPHCRGRSGPETVVFPAAAFVLAGVSFPWNECA